MNLTPEWLPSPADIQASLTDPAPTCQPGRELALSAEELDAHLDLQDAIAEHPQELRIR
ncbi:hypothetical protein AGRA3207_007487 [Actinomadura graeca]|uniref:Uncharacterized protein n=1 Tax=Actinomadura graeca TaxID=2750812 RepID=A0ABX8R511_9ACTN|nr:hypothetical protein [Actinomadura graeca]QXJ25918.1 hypothetical protein AGRA3207_007487 [Actinomadura graeca]